MTGFDLIIRLCAFIVIGLSLGLARAVLGRGIDNIPLWSGIGVTLLYACYCAVGIQFSNGSDAMAELTFASLIAVNTVFFILGVRAAPRPVVRPSAQQFSFQLPRPYIWVLLVVSIGFYTLLTQGQPWRLVTDTVGLKFERLSGIHDKDPILLNLDALVEGMTLVAFAWAILVYKDDRRSRTQLIVTTGLVFLYVISTGSRSPFLAVAALALPAFAEARKRSLHMAWLSRRKWYFVSTALGAIVFLIIVTAMRIEVELLDKTVFSWYFGIDSFGVIDGLVSDSNPISFFLSTAIVYASSTFNNVVIRFQELSSITPTIGYRFVFFYAAAAQILAPGFLQESLADWRDLAVTNNLHLTSITEAAGQWATPYGDLLWDFGIIGAFITTAIISFVAGVIVGRARYLQSFPDVLLKVIVVGFTILPLVNPLLSLYVHHELMIALFIICIHYLFHRTRSESMISQPD